MIEEVNIITEFYYFNVSLFKAEVMHFSLIIAV